MTDRPHVEVTLVSYRGLVDKSLNLTFNVDEEFKRAALELFSDIGATGYLFRIAPEAAKDKMIKDAGEPAKPRVTFEQVHGILSDDPENQPKEPTGPNCNKAINLCKDKDFWSFLEHQYKTPMITSPYFAAKQLKRALGIESRRELDENAPLEMAFLDFVNAFEIWRPGDAEL